MRLKILPVCAEKRLPNEFQFLGHTSELKLMLLGVPNPRLPYFAPRVSVLHGSAKTCKIFQITLQRGEMKTEAASRRLKPGICQGKIEKGINLAGWQFETSGN